MFAVGILFPVPSTTLKLQDKTLKSLLGSAVAPPPSTNMEKALFFFPESTSLFIRPTFRSASGDVSPALTCSSSHCPRREKDGHPFLGRLDTGKILDAPREESHLLAGHAWSRPGWNGGRSSSTRSSRDQKGQMEREQEPEETWRNSGNVGRPFFVPFFSDGGKNDTA